MKPADRSPAGYPALRIFAVCLVLAAWLVVPLPSLAFGLPRILLLSFCTLLMTGALLFSGGPAPLAALHRSWPGRFLLLYALVVALSPLWSVAPPLSLVGAAPRYEGVLVHLLYVALACIGVTAGVTASGRRLLTHAIVAANGGIVLYGLLQMLGADPLAHLWGSEVFLGRTFSLIGQPNTLGLFIVLTVPFVILSSRLGPDWWRQAGLALFLLNVLVLLSTVSRSAILGLGIAFLFSLVWMRRSLKPVSRKQRAAVILCAIALAGAGAYYSVRRFSVPTEAGRSVEARAIIWQGALQMAAARPAGYGLETFGILSARHFPGQLLRYESLTTRIDRAHSKPLDLLVTLGPPGLLAYYGFVITLLWSLWARRGERGMQEYFLTGFLSVLGAGITLLFGFDVPATAAYFWLICGMMLGPMLPAKDGPVRRQQVLLLPLLAALAALLVLTVQWSRARVLMDRAEQWFTRGSLVQAMGTYAQAADAFRLDRSLLVRALETDLMALEQAQDAETAAGISRLIGRQLTALETLTGGEDGMALLLRAWAAAIAGEEDSVDWLLLQAAMRQPPGVVHYRIALHCYELLGNTEKKAAVYRLLIRELPPAWRNPQSPHGRLLWKEHPWLEEVRAFVEGGENRN